MRHLGSLLASVIIAPLAWILLALGQAWVYANWDSTPNGGPPPVNSWLEPVGYLAAAGLLVGLIAVTRVSPLGPVLAGTAYLAFGVAGLAEKSVYTVLPDTWRILDRDIELHRPIDSGTAIVLGTLLLVAVVSAGRWRRSARAAGAVAGGAAPQPIPEAVDGDPALTPASASASADAPIDGSAAAGGAPSGAPNAPPASAWPPPAGAERPARGAGHTAPDQDPESELIAARAAERSSAGEVAADAPGTAAADAASTAEPADAGTATEPADATTTDEPAGAGTARSA